MTFPNIPYPKGTPLYPCHTAVRSYYENVVKDYNLEKYIHLEHNVVSAQFANEKWTVEFDHRGEKKVSEYDKLIVANGHYKFPYYPTWDGQEEWLRSGEREIEHSLWYRGPEKYAGRVVIVIGYGGSRLDIAGQTTKFATEVSSKKQSLSQFFLKRLISSAFSRSITPIIHAPPTPFST